MVEMVFIFIQALQLQKVPKNLKDIGIGLQECVPNPTIIAVANRMAITPSWSEINIYNRLGETVVLIDGGE